VVLRRVGSGRNIHNARTTTHLGSGGVSFAPAAVVASRAVTEGNINPVVDAVLDYSRSNRRM
jgi:hypothetical protein